MLMFLETSGFAVTVSSSDELYQFTMDIATSVLDKAQIEGWLRTHTVSTHGCWNIESSSARGDARGEAHG